MFVAGLTGGIGSGKTAVSDYFQSLGITIVDADVVSREVVEPGTPALEEIRQRFGDSILLDDGSLNRSKLRDIVFSQAEDKTWLEALLHPLIGSETFKQISEAPGEYVVYAAPLLLESGNHSFCDAIVAVDVTPEKQIERTMSRDNNSEAQVSAIMNAQIERSERLKLATHIVDNSDTLAALHQKVDELHAVLLAAAKDKEDSQ